MASFVQSTYYKSRVSDDTNESERLDVINGEKVEDDNDGESDDANDTIDVDGILKTAPPEDPGTPDDFIEYKVYEKEDNLANETKDPDLVKNTRPLSKAAKTYELEKFKKNYMLVLNQIDIDWHKTRLGTEKDESELFDTFTKFGFVVEVRRDLRKRDIMKKLDEISNQDFSEYGCVAVVVLTHGTSGGGLRAKDGLYSEQQIIRRLNSDANPTLLTKPKVVIIQACRGSESTRGLIVAQETMKVHKDFDEDVEPYTLPAEVDMLVLHSSYVGKPSHRTIDGSWFIQSLCNQINRFADKLDLEAIMTTVKREVAIDYYYEEERQMTSEVYIHKQTPVVTSTLMRKLYLRRYVDSKINWSSIPTSWETESESEEQNPKDYTDSEELSSCYCFLKHYQYLVRFLTHYTEDCPDDLTARSFLEVAVTFEDGPKFHRSKQVMIKAISDHLSAKKSIDYLKFLYLNND